MNKSKIAFVFLLIAFAISLAYGLLYLSTIYSEDNCSSSGEFPSCPGFFGRIMEGVLVIGMIIFGFGFIIFIPALVISFVIGIILFIIELVQNGFNSRLSWVNIILIVITSILSVVALSFVF